MTDAQFGALIAVLGTIGTALVTTLRWAVARITKALDDNSETHRESAKAQIESAKAMAVLSTKIDHVYQTTEAVRDFVIEERSGVHDAPTVRDGRVVESDQPQPRAKTDPPTGGGAYSLRLKRAEEH